MLVLVAIAITSWCCTLIAAPRRPLPGNEVQELIYARLLGRQQRIALAALVMTATVFLALLATVPARLRDETGGAERLQICYDTQVRCCTCSPPFVDGAWSVEQVQSDGA